MSPELVFGPLEAADSWLAGLLDGAPLIVVLALAVALGLRHASDPDHLVAVSSLVACEGGGWRGAARLGACWGAGHAAMLVAIGVPLIALESQFPRWLERAAEASVGAVIAVLALRVAWKWSRGDYRAGPHRHPERSTVGSPRAHRHLRRGASHTHRGARGPWQAFGIGALHGLAGTGAIVVLLIAALPDKLEATLALGLFAPMSALSMTAITGAFAWLLTRPLIAPACRRIAVPVLGITGLLFGLWYAGLA